MSDRSFVASDRAFGSLLTSMRRRAATAQRRQRWPGATQLAFNDYYPITPTAIGATSWEDLLSIDLDAGSWVLLATSTLRLRADTATSNLFRAGLSFSNDERSQIAGQDLGDPSTFGDQRLEVSLNTYRRLATRSTVTLRCHLGYAGTLIGFEGSQFENTYVLAIPT